MFGNLLKAAIGVVVTPAAVVVDLVTLPARAFDNKDPFHSSTKVLKSVGENLNKALEP